MTLQTRFRAYAPDGAVLGILDEPPSWDASLPVNDVSGMNLTYPVSGNGSAWLDAACEVALEVSDGGAWSEPANARYLRVVVDSDPTEGEAAVARYTLPGYAYLMKGVAVLPYATGGVAGNYDSDGKRKFLSATPGRILRAILAEARELDPQIRGGLTLGFTDTQDSAGVAWSKVLTIYYEPGTSLLTIVDNLAQQGMVDWVMQGRELRVFNPDTALATHRDGVVIRGSEEEAPTKATIEGLRHIVMLRGDEGRVWLQSNTTAEKPWGKSLTVINQGGVRDEGTALSLIGAELQSGLKERVQYTRSIMLDGEKTAPLVDYKPGDYVKARGNTGVLESFRVHQITIRSARTATLTLNDRFEDASIRQAKRQKGIAGGASGDAGAGTLPSRPDAGSRRPAAPTGLVVESGNYVDSAGYPQAVVTAGFDAQPIGVDGLPLTLQGVELWGGSFADDKLRRLTLATESPVAFSPLPAGELWSFRARSVAVNGVTSAFTDVVTVTLAEDLTAPPAPSTPTATARLGVVTIKWDGKDFTGGSMPVDFDHCDVVQGPIPGTVVGSVGLGVAGDVFHVTGLPYNTPMTFWLRAVDTSGNVSDASDSVTVSTTPLVDTDLIGRVIGDANIKLDAIKAELIADGAVLQDKLADNAVSMEKLDTLTQDAITDAAADATTANGRVTTSTSAPTTGGGAGKPVGALWFRYNTAGSLLGTWRWNGTSWDMQAWGADALASGAVTTAKIAANAVTVAEIANNAVEAAKIASNAVTTAKIAPLAVTTAELAAGAVVAGKIAAGAVTAGTIAANAVTATEILAGTITAASGILANASVGTAQIADAAITNAKIASLDAGKISTGYLDAARIAAGSIIASKIAIGDFTNYASGSDFENAAMVPWNLTDPLFRLSTGDKQSGLQCLVIDPGATTRVAGWKPANVEVKEGDQFYIELWARSASGFDGTSGNSKLSVRGQSGIIGALAYSSTVITTSWAKYSTTVTVPAGNTSIYFDLRADHTVGTVSIDNIVIRRMATGELLVDGAVTTRSIATGAITAEKVLARSITTLKIATNAVTANEIAALTITANELASNSITTAKIAALQIEAGHIKSNAITADKINAGAVTAIKLDSDAVTTDKLDALAITSKHTITGATLQTTGTANRGIKITSAGLKAYNASGTETINIDSSTGAATFSGTVRNKPSGPRVEINSSDTRGIVRWYTATAGSSAASITSDPDGEGLLLYSGAVSGGVRRSTLQLYEQGANNTAGWFLGQAPMTGSTVEPMGYIQYFDSTFLRIARTATHRIDFNTSGYIQMLGVGVQVYGDFAAYNGSKSFIMDHPTKPGKQLTHASTESPVNGVEYWSDGFVTIPETGVLVAELPDYFEALTASDHRVPVVTAGGPGGDVWATPVTDGSFEIHGTPGTPVTWVVKARRVRVVGGVDKLAFDVEADQTITMPEEINA